MKKIKISYNAPVTLSFVLICFLVTIVGILTNGRTTVLLFSAYRGPLSNPMFYLRLFTHVLGHSGLDHFIGNAIYLLLVGPMLEEKHGSNTMLKIILLTALVTGSVHCIFQGNYSLCGASGILFSYIILSSFTAFREGEIPMSFILVAFLYIGQEIYNGIAIKDNISNITHILGGIVGSFAGYSLNRKK